MPLIRILSFLPNPLLALAVAFSASPALAVATDLRPNLTFAFDLRPFRSTLKLDLDDEIQTVYMSESQMQARVVRSRQDSRVEPLTLLVADDESQIAAMAERLALAGRTDALIHFFKRALKSAKPIKDGSSIKTIEISNKAFALIDKAAFAELFARTHHKLTLSTDNLRKDQILRTEFMRELEPFLNRDQRQAILAKIAKRDRIDVDDLLLPSFPRKMAKKYVIYRGPNCFHAALAFQSPAITSSSLINVKRETNYHRAMINYDELWRAINQGFYEVDPKEQPLKYGDMLVFFDVPQTGQGAYQAVDFRWIRHTATYLFNGYTFSKGSKSPNTPYTVRTLAEEWQTWKRYTTNLGVKVFRRSQETVSKRPPMDLTDWLY